MPQQVREARADGAAQPAPGARHAPSPEGVEREPWMACSVCGAAIAPSRAKLEVNGAQQHSFINPAGLIFRVGCFASAPGARVWGQPSSDWTWFPGFTWQVATCGRCHEHLGWGFQSPGQRFVALIVDKLVERPGPAAS